jgi:hypothetical protein
MRDSSRCQRALTRDHSFKNSSFTFGQNCDRIYLQAATKIKILMVNWRTKMKNNTKRQPKVIRQESNEFYGTQSEIIRRQNERNQAINRRNARRSKLSQGRA